MINLYFFFKIDAKDVIGEYKRIIKYALGIEEVHTRHIEQLHELGYLPIYIKAVPG